MAYDNSIPQASDKIKDSQPEILANFVAIKTLVDINHVTFDDPDEGKHKWVTFPTQGAPVGSYPTTAASEIALFSQTSAYTTATELAIRKESDGDVYEFTAAQKASAGWTILPSGILIKWGYGGAASGTTTISWPVAGTIPVFGAVYHVQVSPIHASTSDVDVATRLIDFNTTRVRVYSSKRTETGAAATSFSTYILAIGIPA